CENECKNKQFANIYCKECRLLYCSDCDQMMHGVAFKTHERVKPSYKHRVGNMFCSEHKGELLKLYCLSCKKPICRDCKDSVLGCHSTHKFGKSEDCIDAPRAQDRELD